MKRLEKDEKLYQPPLMPALSSAWHSMHTAMDLPLSNSLQHLYLPIISQDHHHSPHNNSHPCNVLQLHCRGLQIYIGLYT